MLGEMGGIGCSRVAQTVTQTGCVVVWWGERERGRCGWTGERGKRLTHLKVLLVKHFLSHLGNGVRATGI
jgi:hypothetical protein